MCETARYSKTTLGTEQQTIRRALQVTSGNKSEVARLLRTDYKTLHFKMKDYGIPAGQFREFGESRP